MAIYGPDGYQNIIDQYLHNRGRNEKARYVGTIEHPLRWAIYANDSRLLIGVFEPKPIAPAVEPFMSPELPRTALKGQLRDFLTKRP